MLERHRHGGEWTECPSSSQTLGMPSRRLSPPGPGRRLAELGTHRLTPGLSLSSTEPGAVSGRASQWQDSRWQCGGVHFCQDQ